MADKPSDLAVAVSGLMAGLEIAVIHIFNWRCHAKWCSGADQA